MLIFVIRVQDEEDELSPAFGISRSRAQANYHLAGSLVRDPPSEFSEDKFSSILTPSAVQVFQEASSAFPYTPVDFQKIGACALYNGHHLALRIGTGEGKMTVPLLASKMMSQSGKVIVTQPLDGLLMQTLNNSICKAAFVTMGGEVVEGGGCRGSLSHELDYIMSEDVELIVGHPESFATPTGKQLLAELERKNLIKLIVFDEVHTMLHWSSFREDIMRVSASIRAYAPEAPVCIMSATVTTSELRSLVKQLDLSPNPVLLANSPMKSHIKFSFVRRPANAFGVEGIEDGEGQLLRPGLIHMLKDLYFDDMFEDMKQGRTPKRAIIFFRGLEKQAAVASFLRAKTGLRSAKEAFFVSVHSELRPPTVKG